MIKSDFFLSNVGAQFDGHNDLGRDEVEHNIQGRYQGIKPGLDYIFQPRVDSWQLNGITPVGARAVASVAMGMHLQPNRIDITLEQLADVESRALVMDFDTLCQLLTQWFKRHKPNTQIEFMTTGSDTGRLVIGARTARFSITVEQISEKLLSGLRVTFKVRQDNVMPTWFFLQNFHAGEEYLISCRNAFAACTSTFLSPDWFGIGLDKDLYLLKEKEVTKSDYWGFLAGVASKIVSEAKKSKSMRLTEESLTFLTNEVAKGVIREAKRESNISATLDRLAEVGYN